MAVRRSSLFSIHYNTPSPLATPTVLIDHAPNHTHLSLELVSLPLLLTGATKLDLVGHLLDEHLLLLALLILDTKRLVLCVCVCVCVRWVWVCVCVRWVWVCVWCGRVCGVGVCVSVSRGFI